ncbi:hypothetical protein ACFX13_013731 [Malus domestica]
MAPAITFEGIFGDCHQLWGCMNVPGGWIINHGGHVVADSDEWDPIRLRPDQTEKGVSIADGGRVEEEDDREP